MKNFFTIVLSAILLFAFSTAFGQWPPMHAIDSYLNGAAIVDVHDINGDGDLDVAATGYRADDVVWYKNEGGTPINWTKYTIDGNLDIAVGVDIADIDGDDTLDVVAAGMGADRVVWYENRGGMPILWDPHTIDANLDGAAIVYVADIDGDSSLDVVATGLNADAVVWYENSGGTPINWTKNLIDTNLDGAQELEIVDLDGDMDPDIVAAGSIANVIVWYENPTWTKDTIDANLLRAWEVRAADIDGDNDPDLVATGRDADVVVWYRNNGGSPITWTKYIIDGNLNGAVVVDIADIDLDSDLDVFATGFDADSVVWYENVGGTPINWIRRTIDANLNGAAHIFAVDIDDDNDPDAVVTGQEANKVVWYENTFHTGIELLPGIAPTGYVLSQNYPNPFNPKTVIEFSIPKSEFVTLKVYNILGEEVATLVSQRLAAGQYKYDWDASTLASGVYLYRLQAGDYAETRKMVLLQ